jgi:diketogulonate reductase-like aldo/keto reductase
LAAWHAGDGLFSVGDGSLVHDPTLARIGAAHNCSATAVALAWVIGGGDVIAIPEAGSAVHVNENADALSLTLTPQELQTLNTTFSIQSANMLRSFLDRSKRWLRRLRNGG